MDVSDHCYVSECYYHDVVFEGLAEPVSYLRCFPEDLEVDEYTDYKIVAQFGYGKGLRIDDGMWAQIEDDLAQGTEPDVVESTFGEYWDYKESFEIYHEEYTDDLRYILSKIEELDNPKRTGLIVLGCDGSAMLDSLMDEAISSFTEPVIEHRSEFYYCDECQRSPDGKTRERVRKYVCSLPGDIENYDAFYVVGGIVESGYGGVWGDAPHPGIDHFATADYFLRQSGFKGRIENVALACAMSRDEAYLTKIDLYRCAAVRKLDDVPIDAIVLGLSQTVLDDSVRDMEFEGGLGEESPMPYRAYPGASQLKDISMPWAIVSNSSPARLRRITMDGELCETLGLKRYGEGELPEDELPENVFSVSKRMGKSGNSLRPKPRPDGINRAIEYLLPNIWDRRTSRVVGLGNTPEDMVAYSEAGIESCLALWGVPKYLREEAIATWPCTFRFETFEDFMVWCQERDPEKERRKKDAASSTAEDQRSGVKTGTDISAPAESKSNDPSLSTLIRSWKARSKSYAEALDGFSARHGNRLLRLNGYITKDANGEWTTTEEGAKCGIVARREQFQDGTSGMVLRYPSVAARTVEELVKSKFLYGVSLYDRDEVEDDDDSGTGWEYGRPYSIASQHRMSDYGLLHGSDGYHVFQEHPLAEVYDSYYTDSRGVRHYYDSTVDCGDGDD